MRLLIYNPAGGSGKTTLARNLAHELGKMGLGLNVLILDLDAKSQLSRMCGKIVEFHRGQTFELAELASGSDVPVHSNYGIQILPGGPKSFFLELTLYSKPMLKETLTASLEPLMAQADITILDVAPGYSAFTLYGMDLATHVLIPFDLSPASFLNAKQISKRLQSLSLKQIGFVPMQTRGDGSTARGILKQAKTDPDLRDCLFPTVQFRQSILVAEKRYLPLQISNHCCSNVRVFQAIAKYVQSELHSSMQKSQSLPLSNLSPVPFTP